MIVINANDLCLSFGENVILDHVNFSIAKGRRVGLVGKNGTGKTTLLRVLMGEIQSDLGQVFIAKNHSIGFLEQETKVDQNKTILEGVLEIFKDLMDVEKELQQLEKGMGLRHLENDGQLAFKQYDQKMTWFQNNGGYEYRGRAKGILRGLGFIENDFQLKYINLSAGQRTRILLARLLAKNPEILILDEPTNHLDISSIAWLENFLQNFKKTILVVSHDRYFLDRVCNEIIELDEGTQSLYRGNYSFYVEQKRKDEEIQQRLFLKQQRERERIEEIIKQQRQWNREKNIISANSRQKALDRMESVEVAKTQSSQINVDFREELKSGKDVIKVEDLSVAIQKKEIFKDFSFSIQRGERVFLIGKNGCGKTTLLKTLLNKQESQRGEVQFGQNVTIGYMDQDLTSLDPQKTLYDEFLTIDKTVSGTKIRNILSQFGFSGDDVFKKIQVLSGGEKSRLLLAKLILETPNLLLLDEPTNHLDIQSKEVLENALLDFNGTLLCVSHDRYLIKKLANRFLFFHEGSLIDYRGDYESFNEWLLGRTSIEKEDESLTKGKGGIGKNKEDYLKDKQHKAMNRKRKKESIDAIKRVSIIETQLEMLENELRDETNGRDHVKLSEFIQKKDELETEILNLYDFLAKHPIDEC